MELREFIAETLVQIQEDVQDAIKRRASGESSAGVINPVFGINMDAAGDTHIQKVEFDVAVTVTEKSGGGGKAGIKVFSMELGGSCRKGPNKAPQAA